METHVNPIAEKLFTWPDERPRLIGSRRQSTGEVSFPSEFSAGAPDSDVEEVLLSAQGTLHTWTTQQFRPPSPPYAADDDASSFEPYAVGYIELPEGILIEARLTESDPSSLVIGQPMTLEIIPFRVQRARGKVEDCVTFAFAPVSSAGQTEGNQV